MKSLNQLKRSVDKIKKHHEEIHKLAKTDNRVMCCLVLEGLTAGDIDVKNLDSKVYKYTHAVNSSCKHSDWIKEMKQDYKWLIKIGMI